MAVVVTMELATATTEQYDQVIDTMNLGGKTAPNGIFHACAEDPAKGIFICDTWESAERSRRSARARSCRSWPRSG